MSTASSNSTKWVLFAVAAVPEPSTSATMVLGFAGVGFLADAGNQSRLDSHLSAFAW